MSKSLCILCVLVLYPWLLFLLPTHGEHNQNITFFSKSTLCFLLSWHNCSFYTMRQPFHPPSSDKCWFYWLWWRPHFISPSVPLTCQHQSCCCSGTKPSWWITPLPHRTSVFPPLFSSISILYTQIRRGEAKSRKIASLCHHHSYSWLCWCLICWVCFSVCLNLISIIPLTSSFPPSKIPVSLQGSLFPKSSEAKDENDFGNPCELFIFIITFSIISTFFYVSVFVSDHFPFSVKRFCTQKIHFVTFLHQKYENKKKICA